VKYIERCVRASLSFCHLGACRNDQSDYYADTLPTWVRTFDASLGGNDLGMLLAQKCCARRGQELEGANCANVSESNRVA
jgi:hypothetical protein